MLKSLSIKNYALIESLLFEPSEGFSAITGETGAGKSIMLGALNLLTGERADSKTLLDDSQKCVIEAIFSISKLNLSDFFTQQELDYQEDTVIRREISPQGKSRAFINDTPVNLDILSEISAKLMDIHSQHDNLLLATSKFQLNIIDAFAQNASFLNQYFIDYQAYKQLVENIEKWKIEASQMQKEFDFNSYLLSELLEAKLEIGEQELLENEVSTLENAEDIKLKLNTCAEILSGSEIAIENGLAQVLSQINQLAKISNQFDDLRRRILALVAESKDITNEISRFEEKTELDPERLAQTRERIDLIYKLQKKHGVSTIEKLIEIQQDLDSKTVGFSSISEQIENAEKQRFEQENKLKKLALSLSESRKKQFKVLENQVIEHLKNLGMPNNTFLIECNEIPFTETGIDKINMLFSANKGVNPVALKNAASGGEFSRLMFALKYIMAEKTALPTLVFDEIDTGISGEIALKMADMMQKIAQKQQIITITHLHQIAAKGTKHFFVYKDEKATSTKTNIRLLSDNERITKIAEMIGGSNPSLASIESAKEMLL
ncbi:MAG: DNA repair protein RecN [Bacteroidetes bacterium]|nr:MAG: DNA repair protein RecN [Bacteroidota bacterium]